MKHTIILWLILGWVSSAMTQTITVRDQNTKIPLEGVVLSNLQPPFYVVTDTQGQADISAFVQSENIHIQILAYKPKHLSYEEIKALNFTIDMASTVLNLDEIVVSGTRWQQHTSDVPAQIASISPTEIRLQNPQTAADLLGLSGKVFIQKSQQGGGSPMIRGFAANRLIYTVDGVRMNNAIFRGGNLQNVINLDPFVMENTEVYFGPGSVIYGSDAIGGVMSFQTITPKLSSTNTPLTGGKALLRYASANRERTGHVDFNVGWKKWSIASSFSRWDFDHLRQGRNGPKDYIKTVHPQRLENNDVVNIQDDPLLQVPSAYSQYNLMQKIRFKPNENWDFQYGFHYSQTSPYGRYDRHNRFKNGTVRYAEWNYGPQKWMMNNFSVKHKDHNKLYDQMSFRLAQQTFEESRIDRSLHDVKRSTQTEKVQAYSANIDFIKTIDSKNKLYYGLEYVKNDVVSTGMLTDINTEQSTEGPSRYPLASWQSMAVYANNDFQLSNKWKLQAGLRYNQYILEADFSPQLEYFPFPFSNTRINNGVLTGSLGTVYRPAHGWVVKASLGTAFRSPNVDDIGKVFDSEPGAVTVPNTNLNPEYAYTFDIGLTKVFDDKLKLEVTGYYTFLKNALVRRNFQLNRRDSILYDGQMSQVQAIQNAAFASVYGLQSELEVKLPVGFSFISTINYQRGTEEMDNGIVSPSRHAAPLFGISRLCYQKEQFRIELNASYQGRRNHEKLAITERTKDEIYAKDEQGNNFAPAWYTLNLKTMFQIKKGLQVSAGIENLTDQRYRPYSSGISGAGRNFILSACYDFKS